MLDVYKSIYKFSGEPFRLSPDHRFSYVHSSYANARAYLEYAISQGEGFVAITGEPGAGKTTLISGLLAELDKTRINVATLKNLQLDPDNLIEMVANEFGLHIGNKSKSSLLLELERSLKYKALKGQRAVLIIDEAQGLSSGSLEELRLLSNLQYDNCLLLQVFLVGQEKLMDMIRSPDMEHLRQRLIASSHIDRLGLEETVSYIEHRLCCVGWQGDPAISEETLRLIHKCSSGIPRRINLICQRLFLYGGLNQKHTLVEEDIRHVVEELDGESVLTPGVPEEDDKLVAESEGDNTPGLSLPRASMCPHVEEHRQTPPPEPEPLILHTPLQPPSAPAEEEECNNQPPVRENRLDQGGIDIDSPSMPGEPATVSRWGKYRWGLVVPVLLAGLVLVPAIKTGIKYYQLNFTSTALIEDRNHSPAVATRETVLADDLTASAYNGLDQSISEIDTSGSIQRYSPSTTLASESANALQFADESNEQRLQPDNRNIITSDIGTHSRTLLEVDHKSAELNSDSLEPVDDQVATATARIETEHSRLRNSAEQRFNRKLKEDGLVGLPTAN